MTTFAISESAGSWRWPFRPARVRLTHWNIAAPVTRPVLLQRGATLMIDKALELEVRCIAGCVWLTQDNDPRDIVLKANESALTQGNALILIQALEDAQVRLSCARRPR